MERWAWGVTHSLAADASPGLLLLPGPGGAPGATSPHERNTEIDAGRIVQSSWRTPQAPAAARC